MDGDDMMESSSVKKKISASEAQELRAEVKRLSWQFREERARHQELLELRYALDMHVFRGQLGQLRARVVALQSQLNEVVKKLVSCVDAEVIEENEVVTSPRAESVASESSGHSIQQIPPAQEQQAAPAEQAARESLEVQSAAISEERQKLAQERAALEATLVHLAKRVKDTDHKDAESKAHRQYELATAQLEAVARREALLEDQRQHLSRKHAQLAEDLADKQDRLNREWAELDMAASREGGALAKTEQEGEREAMQAEWAAIQEQWEAIEECKAQTPVTQEECDSAGKLGLFGGWREALDGQLADIAEEQEAGTPVLQQDRPASLASESTADSSTPAAEVESDEGMQGVDGDEEQPAVSTPVPVQSSAKVAPILKRGDSPRELEAWERAAEEIKEEVQQEAPPTAPDTPSATSSPPPKPPKAAASPVSQDSCRGTLQGPLGGLLDSVSSFDDSPCYLRSRADQLKDERTKLWSSVANPEEMVKRLRRLERMEAQQAQREMQLQAREAVDQRQQAEMVLARSLALDKREKLLVEKERALCEASARAFSRDAELQKLRSKIRSLEGQLHCRRRSMERRNADTGYWKFACRKPGFRRRPSISRDSLPRRDSIAMPSRSVSMPLGALGAEVEAVRRLETPRGILGRLQEGLEH